MVLSLVAGLVTSQDQLEVLQNEFLRIDKDKNGSISREEMFEFLKQLFGMEGSQVDYAKVMNRRTIKKVNKKGQWDDSSDDENAKKRPRYSTEVDKDRVKEEVLKQESEVREIEEEGDVDIEEHAAAILELIK